MSHVTGHVTKRDSRRDGSRVTVHVSHATTTTPHHTISLVAVVCGVSGPNRIRSNGDLRLGFIGFGDRK